MRWLLFSSGTIYLCTKTSFQNDANKKAARLRRSKRKNIVYTAVCTQQPTYNRPEPSRIKPSPLEPIFLVYVL